MSQEDPYAVLGVASTAEHWLIQLKYRTLMRRYHPDVGTEPDTARAQEINEAYDVLGDPEKRRRYDARSAFGNSNRPKEAPPPRARQRDKEAPPVERESGTLSPTPISDKAIAWWLVTVYFALAAFLYLRS